MAVMALPALLNKQQPKPRGKRSLLFRRLSLLLDFFLYQHYEWNDATFLGRVEEETGKKFVKSYEKLIGAITGIQNLESYKNYSGPLKIYHSPDFCKPDEFYAEYKNAN